VKMATGVGMCVSKAVEGLENDRNRLLVENEALKKKLKETELRPKMLCVGGSMHGQYITDVGMQFRHASMFIDAIEVYIAMRAPGSVYGYYLFTGVEPLCFPH
jgi:hypothetical protein